MQSAARFANFVASLFRRDPLPLPHVADQGVDRLESGAFTSLSLVSVSLSCDSCASVSLRSFRLSMRSFRGL